MGSGTSWHFYKSVIHSASSDLYGTDTQTSMITLRWNFNPSMEFYGGSMESHGIP